jgi:Na+-translocating ferredoxin:NAD+ oxidoreductase subunit B
LDVYRRLARKLDALPHGYPSTASGVELRILRKVFEPEDAALAVRLRAIPERAEAIARRVGRPVGEVQRHLESMADRGQVGASLRNGVARFSLVPFVVGIYELQLERLDKELADLFEEYVPHLMKTLGGSKPAVARVVPVNVKVDAKPQILPHDDLRALLSKARSFRVAPCICRKEQALEGHPCSHTLETCLSFSSRENAYERFPPGGRAISREEAMRVIEAAEEEGLVHCTYNVQREPLFVCNCCTCCCGFIRGIRDFQAPYFLARSGFVARVEAESCNACAACSDGRCPMGAISSDGTSARVEEHRCIGCGVCTTVCPNEALRLHERPAEQRDLPPETIIDWAVERTSSRSPLKGLALRGVVAWTRARRSLARHLDS